MRCSTSIGIGAAISGFSARAEAAAQPSPYDYGGARPTRPGVLVNWKSPNKQSPHRHGDAEGGVPGPGMRCFPSTFRFATQTFEALRPLRVFAKHPFLFAPECLGIGHVLLLTHVIGSAVTGFLIGVPDRRRRVDGRRTLEALHFVGMRNQKTSVGASANHPHIGSRLAKEPFQNIRLRVVASITSKSGSNCHWLPANIRCRTCTAQHMGRLGLNDYF
jgi:hypothetical protein